MIEFILSFQTERGEVSVDADYTDRRIISRLKITMVTLADGGTYTCKHPSSQADSTRIFVVECMPTLLQYRHRNFNFSSYFILAATENTEIMQKDYPLRPLMVSKSGVQEARTKSLLLYIVLMLVTL